MTPGVNLLPARYVERIAERRRITITAVALLVLVLVLVLIAFGQGRRLHQAEVQREVEQARTQELEARRVELAPFRELAEGIVGRERLLAAAMDTQVSWAAVLAGLAAALPADSSLTSFTGDSTLPVFAQDVAVAPGDASLLVGSATFEGYSVETFAPGVAQTLQLLGTVAGLSEALLQEGAVSEIGDVPVTNFDGTAFLDAGAMTGRYVNGLPPAERVEVPSLPAGGPGAASAGGAAG